MRTITNKQYDDYMALCRDRQAGRILTPMWLRTVCGSCGYDPEAIGRYFLEILPKIAPYPAECEEES